MLPLDAWWNVFPDPDLSTSLKLSFEVAFAATIVATILGTFLGLALGRYRFRGAGATNFVIFLAIASPEIVLGSSMLSLFVNARSGAPGVRHDPARPHHVLHLVRRDHGAGARAGTGPIARGGRQDLSRRRSSTFYQGHAAVDLPG